MTTLLVALAGGSVAVMLTWAARLTIVGREVRAHDRASAALDEDLESWIADETVRLERELAAITADMSVRNLLWSGAHGVAIKLAKEAALEAYRNEERRSRRAVADIEGQEGWPHNIYRRWTHRERGLTLRTPDLATPILDRWAAPVTRHLSANDPPLNFDDPRQRSIAATVAQLADNPNELI